MTLEERYEKAMEIEKRYDAAEVAGDTAEQDKIWEEMRNLMEEEIWNNPVAMFVFKTYEETRENGNETLNFDSLTGLYDGTIKLVTEYMKETGIRAFTISAKSTGVTETAFEFCKNGCRVDGMQEVKKRTFRKEYETHPAFRFIVE